MEILNLESLEAAARAKLSEGVYGYYAGGADDEITVSENRAAYRRLRLRYRVLMGIESCDLETQILSESISLPVLVAPTAFQAMAHPEGELATARAARDAGTVMILSTLSTTPMEDVAAVGGSVWFQLYMHPDRALTEDLVHRARAAGCRAIVLTVDAPVLGRRERDVRNRFQLPDGLSMKNFAGTKYESLPADTPGSGLAAFADTALKRDLSWSDVEWLCSVSPLPVLVKGLIHPEDARLAAKHGVAAIVVSNHGGRQLDTAPATIDVLPAVADATEGRIPLIVDGGIRRGTDVVKALARGATAVAVGRPVLWGLAVGGEPGVSAVLEHLRHELEAALMLCGCSTSAQIPDDLIG